MSAHATLSEAHRFCRRAAREEQPARLAITATLAAPSAAGPIPWGRHNLDGLLSYALLDRLGRRPALYQGPPLRLPLPLLAYEHAGCSVWACSTLDPAEPVAKSLVMYRKRLPIEEAVTWLAGRRLPLASGRHRAYQEPLRVAVSTRLQAIAVGYQLAVAELLDRVHAVGKKRAHGYGAVRAWDVRALPGEPDPAWALIAADGAPTRPLPVAVAERLGARGRIETGAWRPPYWLREDWAEIVVP